MPPAHPRAPGRLEIRAWQVVERVTCRWATRTLPLARLTCGPPGADVQIWGLLRLIRPTGMPAPEF